MEKSHIPPNANATSESSHLLLNLEPFPLHLLFSPTLPLSACHSKHRPQPPVPITSTVPTMSAQQRIHLNPRGPQPPTNTQGYTPNAGNPYRPNPSSGMGMGAGGGGADGDVLGQVKAWSSKVEDLIESYTQVSPLPASRGGCQAGRGVQGGSMRGALWDGDVGKGNEHLPPSEGQLA